MTRKYVSEELKETIGRVKPFLLRYLGEHGVQIEGQRWFLCLNPEHNDTSPSMHIVPDSQGTLAKCFSCGASYDIFDAHAILEKKPRKGKGWVQHNVHDLARRYGVPFTEIELTEQEILTMSIVRLYQDAAEVLVEMCREKPAEYLLHCANRGLNQETCLKFGVGSVPWKAFVPRMKARGHDLEFMKQWDISSEMFDSDRISITIRDADRDVVGFARRYVPYDPEMHKAAKHQAKYYPPKYYNTSANVPIFHKEAILYGLDTAQDFSYSRLDIFEGYMSVLIGRQSGLSTCVCSCGTELTEYQIAIAQKKGFTHVHLVGDDDEPGKAAAYKSLQSLAGREGLKATVSFLPFPANVPKKDRDPDGFFRMYGLKAYMDLPEYSGFEWQLSIEMMKGGQPSEIVTRLVPLLMNEPNMIERGRLVRILAERTAVPELDIREELRVRLDREVDKVAHDLGRRLMSAKDSIERREVIAKASQAISETEISKVDFSHHEGARAFAVAIEEFKAPVHGIRGWITGWPQFDSDFDGLPKADEILAIAGSPNCGKSALLTNLAVNLLAWNTKGPTVIYHIMDDPRPVAFAKLMSCTTGIPIRMIRRYSTDIEPYSHLKESYLQSQMWLIEAMRSGRLIVKGQELGTNTQVAERLLEYTQDKVGAPIVYLGDSLHNLDDSEDGSDERVKFSHIAHWAQRITSNLRLTMVFTCELTKEAMKGRPQLYMTAETRAIAYAFKAVGLVYNDLHITRQDAKTFWVDQMVDPKDGSPLGPVQRPIVEVSWQKNKISEFKGEHYFRFWDHTARVAQMNFSELAEEKRKAATARFDAPNQAAIGSFNGVMPYAPPALGGRR